MNFLMVVLDSIPHNPTRAIVKTTLKEAMAVDTSLLSGKIARSLKGNVDVEPAGSMNDSSMILREIGVDVDEGHCPDMTIRRGVLSSVEPR